MGHHGAFVHAVSRDRAAGERHGAPGLRAADERPTGERGKMLAGELYDPLDPDVVARRMRDLGARAVIGAGSVVTRDVPEDVFAAGNPCRVIRSIADQQTPPLANSPRYDT